MALKKFISNIICGCIPNKRIRHRIRMRLTFDIKPYIEFAKRDSGIARPRVRTYQGHGGMKKIIVVISDKIAYKFPLVDARAGSPAREKLYADAFRKYSPIKLPDMELLSFNGRDVLKYEFIRGKTVQDTPRKILRQHSDKIAKDLAEFIFALGNCNPAALRPYIPAGETPGYMRGWYHGDIGGNFIINQSTGEIAAFLDWESAEFCDWTGDIMGAFRFMNNRGAGNIMLKTIIVYSRLYNDYIKNKTK
mgnify:CR=1 FL=1